jgi:DNA-binding XRE family transcriptional regulator
MWFYHNKVRPCFAEMKKQGKKGKSIKKNVEPELKELGARIRELRIAAGYSSAEKFAYANDLSRVSYTKCETGSNMTYMSLRKLLKVHKISIQDFFNKGFK